MNPLSVYPALLLLQQARNPIVPTLFMWGAVLAIFYFILIRPQARQRKAHDAMIRALKKGDEIVTAGGVIGEVLHIKETVVDGQPKVAMDDRITIKSADSRLIIERGRIARVLRTTGAPTS